MEAAGVAVDNPLGWSVLSAGVEILDTRAILTTAGCVAVVVRPSSALRRSGKPVAYLNESDRGKLRLRRSSLITPGDNEKLLAKTARSVADVCIVDWEDGVVPSRKAAAREITAAALATEWACAERVVRTSSMDGAGFADDIRAAVAAGADSIMLPKVENAAQIVRASELIGAAERESGREHGSVEIWALAETVQSVQNADEIAAAPRMTCLLFGGGDLGADMRLKRIQLGANRTLGIHRYEYFYAYSRMVTAARAEGVDVVVTGFTSFADLEGSRADAEISAQFGFTGALAINPRQLPIYNEVFAPSDADLNWANAVLDAVEKAARDEQAVVVVDGSMVDGPFIRNAQHIRALQDLVDGKRAADEKRLAEQPVVSS
ncbi:HpcH/HpaI aldolase/citrate lyase family protein [Amycolatopsis thermoflava]|uniref:HpcH/HpaI aldolase/citrate lyase family protein n=1 Tax=Amycolatopsis thermoflava TaxID=84480 RepID=UPI00383001C4